MRLPRRFLLKYRHYLLLSWRLVLLLCLGFPICKIPIVVQRYS